MHTYSNDSIVKMRGLLHNSLTACCQLVDRARDTTLPEEQRRECLRVCQDSLYTVIDILKQRS